MQDIDIKTLFENAKALCRDTDNHLQTVLDCMVKAGVAKVVNDQDDAWEICVVGEKSLLDKVVYMEFEGEDWQYMDFDNNEIVLHPGEKLEWFIKKDIA